MIFLLFVPIFAFTGLALYLLLRKQDPGDAARRSMDEGADRRKRVREVMENPALRGRR
jgi:hypothetical protein